MDKCPLSTNTFVLVKKTKNEYYPSCACGVYTSGGGMGEGGEAKERHEIGANALGRPICNRAATAATEL